MNPYRARAFSSTSERTACASQLVARGADSEGHIWLNVLNAAGIRLSTISELLTRSPRNYGTSLSR